MMNKVQIVANLTVVCHYTNVSHALSPVNLQPRQKQPLSGPALRLKPAAPTPPGDHAGAERKENMLRSTESLKGYRVLTADGEIGEITDLVLDDDLTVRYLVVDTGNRLERQHRHVPISTCALGEPDYEARILPVTCTWEQVKTSPNVNFETPMSRKQLADLHRHYQWQTHWGRD
jgi:hypothetical protein